MSARVVNLHDFRAPGGPPQNPLPPDVARIDGLRERQP